jgi:rubrerythrin
MSKISTLELAMRNERAEAEFYEREAQRSPHRAAQSLFSMLAAQEQHHITLLADLHDRLTRQGAWPERIDPARPDAGIAEIVAQLQQSPASPADPDLDQLGALHKAIGFERRAEVFYTELADASSDPGERAFFRAMAGFERDHRRWIEAFKAAIEQEAPK